MPLSQLIRTRTSEKLKCEHSLSPHDPNCEIENETWYEYPLEAVRSELFSKLFISPKTSFFAIPNWASSEKLLLLPISSSRFGSCEEKAGEREVSGMRPMNFPDTRNKTKQRPDSIWHEKLMKRRWLKVSLYRSGLAEVQMKFLVIEKVCTIHDPWPFWRPHRNFWHCQKGWGKVYPIICGYNSTTHL